jgi:hypothetical protein
MSLRTDPARLRRIGLASASVVLAVNIWTGAPLLALWVGSKVAGHNGLSMGAVFVVIVVLGASVLVLATALARVSDAYDTLTGRPVAARRTSPWLRSMRGEREQEMRRRHGISPIERLIVAVVFACVASFEIWFFFFAGSSLPNA